MKRGKRRLWAAAAVLALTVWVLWANTALVVSDYTVRSGRLPAEFSGFRIVQISDLHNASFGKENGKLLSLIDSADPDIIVITGDLVDSRRTDPAIALDFVRDALKIAPVYYVTGNHEARLEICGDLLDALDRAGATVLRDEKLALERDGQSITLMGLDDPSFQYRTTAEILSGMMEPEDGFTVLLSHRPELFETYADCGVDLVFTGHAHGGQFRLPFIGGIIAPHQGLFPRYDAGLYIQDTTHMLVSRGIGNSICPIRFNNRPEIIVVRLDAA